MPRDPAAALSGGPRTGDGEGLPAILAYEQALDDDFNSPWNRFKRFVADARAAGLAGIAALAWPLVLLLCVARPRARRRRPRVPARAARRRARPALAYGLAHEGGDSTNTVLATLLDLVDRGYYETSEATTDDEKLDLALKQKADRPADELTGYEQEVLAFFDQLLDGEQVAMSEMKDEIPQHSEVWRGRWERMTEKLDEAEEGELAWDRNLNWARWLTAAGAAVAFAVVILLALSESEGWLGAVDRRLPDRSSGSWRCPATRFKRLDADHVERTARWQAFARWTEDFPRLSDDPPATLELWKRILVYGVAFGTAERMIASGRIPAPVVADASTGTHWSSYAFVGGFDRLAFDGSGFSSGFASQVAPQSSSSGGGGGFSAAAAAASPAAAAAAPGRATGACERLTVFLTRARMVPAGRRRLGCIVTTAPRRAPQRGCCLIRRCSIGSPGARGSAPRR